MKRNALSIGSGLVALGLFLALPGNAAAQYHSIIDDLEIVEFDGTMMRLRFTTPSWDPLFIQVLSYDVKISTINIYDGNYDDDQVTGPAYPLGSPGGGPVEDLTVNIAAANLQNLPGTVYHVAVNTWIRMGNPPDPSIDPSYAGAAAPNALLTCETTPPEAIASLQATPLSQTSAHLQWTTPHEDFNAPSSALVYRYQVHHSTRPPSSYASIDAWIADAVNTQTVDANFDGLVPQATRAVDVYYLPAGTISYFIVSALDEWSNESRSNTAQAATQAPPPGEPGSNGKSGGGCAASGSESWAGVALAVTGMCALIRRSA